MRKSLRRIANALLAVGVVALFMGSVGTLSFQCGTGTDGCLALLFNVHLSGTSLYQLSPTDFGSVMESTAALPFAGVGWWSLVQLVGGYALFVAVGTLIVLECLELHYLRKIVRSRRTFSFR